MALPWVIGQALTRASLDAGLHPLWPGGRSVARWPTADVPPSLHEQSCGWGVREILGNCSRGEPLDGRAARILAGQHGARFVRRGRGLVWAASGPGRLVALHRMSGTARVHGFAD